MVELQKAEKSTKPATTVQDCLSTFVNLITLDILRRPRDNFHPCLRRQKRDSSEEK